VSALIEGKIHSQVFPNLLSLEAEKCRAAGRLQPVLPDVNDCWSFIWGYQKYTSNKYYQYQFSSLQPHRSIIWIWKTKCIPKIKFFAWLLLNDRLNTRDMLRRKNKFLEEGYNCVLCPNSMEETIEHLFFDCPSATSRWFAFFFFEETRGALPWPLQKFIEKAKQTKQTE